MVDTARGQVVASKREGLSLGAGIVTMVITLGDFGKSCQANLSESVRQVEDILLNFGSQFCIEFA